LKRVLRHISDPSCFHMFFHTPARRGGSFLSVVQMLLVFLFLFPLTSTAHPVSRSRWEAVAVIVNAENHVSLSEEAIKMIFLGEKTVWEADRLVIKVILQPPDQPASRVFNRALFGDNGRRLSRQWVRNIFTGQAPPPVTLPDDRAVMEKVSRDRAAIGFVLRGALGGGALHPGVRVTVILVPPHARNRESASPSHGTDRGE